MSNELIRLPPTRYDNNSSIMIDYASDRPYTIAIIRETKVPRDTRVPLTPEQCEQIITKHGDKVRIVVERCQFRCFTDAEYEQRGIELVDSVQHADLMLGVKEVNIDALVDNRTYIMFSHTIKKQLYNKRLLQAILTRGIRLLDWECMKNDNGLRVIAFGRWAGIVGAHNTVMTWGHRYQRFQLPRLWQAADWATAKAHYANEALANHIYGLRLVLTGDGRVSSGCCEVLEAMGIKRITPEEFLRNDWKDSDKAIYTQLPANELYRNGPANEFSDAFFTNPTGYHSVVWPYLIKANALINGIFWDNRCAPLVTLEQMARPEFTVKVIGDITCDIAPVASLPSTIRPSTIIDPVFGFDPKTGNECKPYELNSIDVMAVDNLPNELPRDASQNFGEMFMQNVLDEMIKPAGASRLIKEATIAELGKLTDRFHYLSDYVS